jgi:magnesium transporter
MSWNGDALVEADLSAADCAGLETRSGVTWINVDGVHDAAVVQRVCDAFHVHPLAVEDILNVTTRTKLDEYAHHAYSAIKEVTWDGAHGTLVFEQISIVFGQRWVITFQERPGDVFDGLRSRLRERRGRRGRESSDWLVHALLDAVVDAAFTAVDEIDRLIDQEEEAAVDDRPDTSPARVHGLRADLIALRRAIAPLREATRLLMSNELAQV